MNSLVAERLLLSGFDYVLPEPLIAQEPYAQRDHSRLMALDRKTGALEHCIFPDLERFLIPGDLLVLNDTKVYPCRLMAKKPGGGTAEIFLLSENKRNLWSALVKGGVRIGKRLKITSETGAEITEAGSDGSWTIRFHGIDDIREVLSTVGKVPLPPYIKRDPVESDRERYQTVYAAHEGAVAAPTAGLHFTQELLHNLAARGVELVTITLHVGPGTFQPVRIENITEHRMLPEQYVISEEAAARINRAKADNRRVIAVGTTSMRTIETAADDDGIIMPAEGKSALFIYPGYQFKIADGLITNFHLPKSTLIMLVSAFGGRENILSAYQEAVMQKYRFYSYGDAMVIL